jgi:hypothetical protein
LFAAVLLGLAPTRLLAWGATGHRLIGRAAMQALPADLPPFLLNPEAARAVGELAREPDRWKDSGREHDSERDPAHFFDMADDGAVFGGPRIDALPATREDYEAALRVVGSDSWKAGWLPYAILDASEQLTKDFAYIRIETAAAQTVADPAHRAWFAKDLVEREALTLRDIGMLAHYVGDGSQPMHVSVHYNGWGAFPNPAGYTTARVHAMFEGAFVHDFLKEADVAAAMPPALDCHCPPATRVADYLAATNRQIIPFFELEKSHAFAGGDPRGVAYAAARLGAGAAMLRDLVADAWRRSADSQAGWPAVRVVDVAAGRVDPFDSLYGAD